MSDEAFASRFGAFIRARRLAANPRITQEHLAVAAGVSQPAVSSWERGEAAPTARALLVILRELDIPMSEIVALLDNGHEPEAA